MTERAAELLAEAKQLQQAGRLEQAAASYGQALALKPDYAEAHNNLGNVLRGLKRVEEAVRSFRRALEIRPEHAGIHSNLGLALGDLGRFDEALASHRRAIELNPDLAPAHNNLGIVLKELDRLDEAVACYRRAVELAPGFAEAHNNLGNALRALKRHDEAIASYRRTLELRPDYAEAHNNLGNVLRDLERPEEAIACYRRALALKPDNAELHNNLGRALQEAGALDEAAQAFDQAIGLDPTLADAYFNRTRVGKIRSGDAILAAMEHMARGTESLPAKDRISLHFALGKAYEDLGRHDEAFRELAEGNRLRWAALDYDEAARRRRFERIEAAFTPSLMASKAGLGSDSDLPIFVIGFPRSGTTLTEQILASHPQVHGAGELSHLWDIAAAMHAHFDPTVTFPECLKLLHPNDFLVLGEAYLERLPVRDRAISRIVDKRPENFMFAGLIQLILPEARILHVRRNPLDVCVSCFSLPLGGDLECASDLGALGRYYGMYLRLMEHWRRVLPAEAMLEIQYEDLIGDLEGQGRRMLEYCDLPWDDRCLAFHETDRLVATPSMTQVRQPLYRSSVERWRRYEKHLGPLRDALAPYMDESGVR
ncbi:MAG: hypothetical protein QOK29_1501 [Rhodospirillaceae bacterium]|nr:hypothetical protein [Rhodospirillaceae bacterium]